MESKIVALSTVGIEDGLDLYDFLIGDSETVLLSFKSVRDRLIVTNKKIISY